MTVSVASLPRVAFQVVATGEQEYRMALEHEARLERPVMESRGRWDGTIGRLGFLSRAAACPHHTRKESSGILCTSSTTTAADTDELRF